MLMSFASLGKGLMNINPDMLASKGNWEKIMVLWVE